MKTANKEPIIFDRYTERDLNRSAIVFDRSTDHHQIRFNNAAIRMLGLGDNSNVQFVQIGDDWFLCSTKEKRGFNVIKTGNSGWRINSKAFLKHFFSEINYSCKTVRFNIKPTKHELAAKPLFQITGSKIIKP